MTAESVYRALLAQFADEGVVGGSLFGWKAFKLDGASLGCVKGDLAAFRLGADNPALAAALQLEGAHHFDPGRKDRPFKDWVAVPITHAAELPDILAAAIEARLR